MRCRRYRCRVALESELPHRWPDLTKAREIAELAYPHLIYFDEVDKGGHFAAWNKPNSLRPSFAWPSVRSANSWRRARRSLGLG
jgi:hypothetical protein